MATPTPRRYWNVAAGLAVVVVLAYIAVCTAALFMGKMDGPTFKDAVSPLVTGVVGYMAALILSNKQQ